MYAEVIVDIAHSAVDRRFTYRIPEGISVEPGHRVLVPFGNANKPVEGFVLGILASAIAFFLQWGLYNFLEVQIAAADSLELITIVPFVEVIEIVAAGYALVGFVVGVFGSVLSIRKFLQV